MPKSQLNVGDFFKCSGHPNRRNSAGLFLLPFESGSIEVSHLIGLFGILYTSQWDVTNTKQKHSWAHENLKFWLSFPDSYVSWHFLVTKKPRVVFHPYKFNNHGPFLKTAHVTQIVFSAQIRLLIPQLIQHKVQVLKDVASSAAKRSTHFDNKNTHLVSTFKQINRLKMVGFSSQLFVYRSCTWFFFARNHFWLAQLSSRPSHRPRSPKSISLGNQKWGCPIASL